MADLIGTNQLFLGNECATWTDAQFKQCAQWAVAHGFDALLVKAGDGTDFYYGGLAGYQHRRDIIRAQGCLSIPYFYSYGDTLGPYFPTEIAHHSQYKASEGVVCIDIEVQWNGRPDLARTYVNAMRQVAGQLLVSTWADPLVQNFGQVVTTLDPVTTLWLPQVYSSNLCGLVQQYQGLNVPWSKVNFTVMAGQDFGPNDPLAHAKVARANGCAGLSFWYYGPATNNAALVQAVLQAGPPKKVTMNIPNGWTYDAARKVLKASNGIEVVAGFCQHILNTPWDPANVPLDVEHGADVLELSNPGLGGGTFQLFNLTLLEWTKSLGVITGYVGLELKVTRTLLQKLQAENIALLAKINELTGQLALLQKTPEAQHYSDVLKSIKTIVDSEVLLS